MCVCSGVLSGSSRARHTLCALSQTGNTCLKRVPVPVLRAPYTKRGVFEQRVLARLLNIANWKL